MEEEKDFLQWYKNKVRENAQDPPEEVWENIADRLDVNDVWGKISEELDERDNALTAKPKPYYYAALILLLLATIAGRIVFDQNKDLPFVTQIEPAENIPVKNKSDKITPDSLCHEGAENLIKTGEGFSAECNKGEFNSLEQPHKSSKSSNINPSAIAKEQPNVVKSDGSDKDGESKDLTTGDNLLPNDSVTASKSSDKKIALLKRLDPLIQFHLPASRLAGVENLIKPLDSIDTEVVRDEENKNSYSRTIMIGLTASVKNTWLLNKTTYRGLEKHTLNTTVPDFGKNIGVLLDYNVSDKLAVQGEVVLSEMGQKYKEYLNGKYVSREVNLEYYSLHVLLKYKINRLLGETGSDIIIGTYGSRLNAASEVIDDKTLDQKNQFVRSDFGAVVGYELSREVLKNVICSSGFRFNYGLMNIYKDRINRTSTGFLALNFAIKYRIGGVD